MSTEVLNFNLTEYTSFRSLQLQYEKARDENATLKAKLIALQQLYRRDKNAFENGRQEWTKKQKKIHASKLQTEKQLCELVQSITQVDAELAQIDKFGLDFGFQQLNKATERMGLTDSKKAKQKIAFIRKCLVSLIKKNNEQAIEYQNQIDLIQQENRRYKKNQKELQQQNDYLQGQLRKVQQAAAFLQNQLSQLKRQYVDYKLKFYQPSSLDQTEKNNKNSVIIEDNNFALDLLNYQKQLLQRIFNKLLDSIQHNGINEKLNDIYSSYESICEVYKQKLQIEYDLQDLEREYKRQKNSKVSENLLIELRKQIEEFRNQLQKQKQSLSKEEQVLQQEFLELKGVERQEKRMKTYSLQLQKKLKTVKLYNQTKKSSLENSQYQQNRIKFKPTQATEELMREVVRQDRQNIEKILKETRMGFLKQTY